jgi:hypothetical protein
MFKKFNTTKLLIILAVLGCIVLFNKFYQSKKEESTFRTEFVDIDSSAVSEIHLYPQVEKKKEIIFRRNGNKWELQSGNIKTKPDSAALRYLLEQFINMKSSSLSGTDKSTWKDLQVTDSAGTKISIVTPSKTYTMIVGKVSYNQSTGNGASNIRHADEEEVYTVPNYLSFAVNQPFNSWRNKTFLSGNKDNWTSFTFTYPSDSSFVLNKESGSWKINGEAADSSKVVQYLNQISAMQSSDFVDNYSPSSTPVYSITINGNNLASPVTVQAFSSDSANKLILHSTQNVEAYFNGTQNHLSDKIFVGKNYFLK